MSCAATDPLLETIRLILLIRKVPAVLLVLIASIPVNLYCPVYRMFGIDNQAMIVMKFDLTGALQESV
jgi:hypothetical protein